MERFTGSDLRRLRKDRRLSISQVAPVFGVTRQRWGGWEAAAKDEPPLYIRWALASWVRGVPPMGSAAPAPERRDSFAEGRK